MMMLTWHSVYFFSALLSSSLGQRLSPGAASEVEDRSARNRNRIQVEVLIVKVTVSLSTPACGRNRRGEISLPLFSLFPLHLLCTCLERP